MLQAFEVIPGDDGDRWLQKKRAADQGYADAFLAVGVGILRVARWGMKTFKVSFYIFPNASPATRELARLPSLVLRRLLHLGLLHGTVGLDGAAA